MQHYLNVAAFFRMPLQLWGCAKRATFMFPLALIYSRNQPNKQFRFSPPPSRHSHQHNCQLLLGKVVSILSILLPCECELITSLL
jgi:hypothetical protein